jgi:hypothetical protein
MMFEDLMPHPCHSRVVFSVGVGIGVSVGLLVGSVVVTRVGEEAVGAMRGLVDRLSGRNNRVNFELLLQ